MANRSFNLLAADFKHDLREFINNQQLPAAMIVAIVREVNDDIQKTFDEILNAEEAQYQEELKREQEDIIKTEQEDIENGNID